MTAVQATEESSRTSETTFELQQWRQIYGQEEGGKQKPEPPSARCERHGRRSRPRHYDPDNTEAQQGRHYGRV